jgi:hypothetical protein
VAANCRVCAATTDTVAGLTAMGKAIVTVASAVLLISAKETAVTVTVGVVGTATGAVYTPVPLIVPTVEFPPATPFTRQVTPVLLVFCTWAVNCAVRPVATVALVGEIVTDTVPVVLLLPPPHPQSNSKRIVQTVQE